MISFHRILFIVGVVVSLLVGISTVSAERARAGLNEDTVKHVSNLIIKANGLLKQKSVMARIKEMYKENSWTTRIYEVFGDEDVLAIFMDVTSEENLVGTNFITNVIFGDTRRIIDEISRLMNELRKNKELERALVKVLKKAIPLVESGEIFQDKKFVNLCQAFCDHFGFDPTVMKLIRKMSGDVPDDAYDDEDEELQKIIDKVKKELESERKLKSSGTKSKLRKN